MTWLIRERNQTDTNLVPFSGPSENDYAFVYLITDSETGKKYVGKKLFWFKKKLIRKTRNKRVLKPSDWESYYGSSKLLEADVKRYGRQRFTREILHLCSSKGEASYLEAKEQFERGVLFKPNEYYNDWIICRVSRKHVYHENRRHNKVHERQRSAVQPRDQKGDEG